MAKNTNAVKWTLLFGTLALFAGIIYVNWDAIRKLIKGNADASGNTDTNNPTTGSTTTGTSTGGVTVIDWNKVLKTGVGSKSSPSSEVLTLQQALNKYNALMGYGKFSPQLVEDGVFGSNTKNALQKCAGVSSITLNQAYALMKNAF